MVANQGSWPARIRRVQPDAGTAARLGRATARAEVVLLYRRRRHLRLENGLVRISRRLGWSSRDAVYVTAVVDSRRHPGLWCASDSRHLPPPCAFTLQITRSWQSRL